jgi:hypothetical protein
VTTKRRDFQTIRSEGGLLPPDLLRRVLDPKEGLDGTRPEDYGLPKGERLNEVITQSWNRLGKHWAEFRAAAEHLPETEPGTGLTNDKWSLPLLRELGFGLLPTTAGPEIGGRTYAINRFFGPVPIHLIGCGLSLDRRAAGVRGAAVANPHGLVQEFINRSPGHLWAIVSNGLRLRVLRNNQALSRQSFLEFDLEAVFTGELYSDFALLWLTAHATRFTPRESDRAETCWLEQWTKFVSEQGTRALGDLRGGVKRALQVLGEGFTGHSKNLPLREALRTGQVPIADFHGQLLRVVYRLIFLFVAEDRTIDGRSLLHPRDDSDAAQLARERYVAHYSTARLRDMAAQIKGSRHGDLWRQFQLLVRALSGDPVSTDARTHLALPTLGGFLWDPASTAVLNNAELTNHDFLEALRNLAFTRQGKVLRPVDYKNLGAEELGGVYEGLLALTPQISADGHRFSFAEFAGNERKTSGSYYTPDSLVQCLLDSALDPVVEEAIKGRSGAEAEKAILALKICDPAVGSGHFLVAAAHRLARHLARIRALAHGESEPSPLLYQQAVRDVIGRCLYGVDMNPMAAELCRVSLWLEALEPGKPLSFLDHHIRVGNSLLGTTPELIAAGLPDETFVAIEGDDKKACTVLKKRNNVERAGLGPLFAEQDAETQLRLEQAATALEELSDDRPEAIRVKELSFRRHEQTEEYRHKKQLADAWCAAFVIRKQFSEPGRESSISGITQGHLNDLAVGRPLSSDLSVEVERLTREYEFFHWYLAFPEVFAKGGFDCISGNPPWERVKIQEKEWFAERSSEIANAPNAALRKQLIEELKVGEPTLHKQFLNDSRKAEGESHLMRNSGRYPLCGRGDINLYAIFAEVFSTLVNDTGRSGSILPCGIATDDTTKHFFQYVVDSRRLNALFGFINEEMLFPSVLHNFKFCLLILGGRRSRTDHATIVFNSHNVEQTKDESRRFSLAREDIALLNPNTRTCPVFFWRQSAEITKAIYKRIPVLNRDGGANEWALRFGTIFHSANDSDLFMAEATDTRVPLYEAKMFDQYNHRYGSYEQLREGERSHMLPEVSADRLQDPHYRVQSFWFVEELEVDRVLSGKWSARWLLGFRNITSAGLWRTTIYSVLPRCGCSDKVPVVFFDPSCFDLATSFIGCMNSFVLDFVSRQKLGGASYSFFIKKQLPVPPPSRFDKPAAWYPLATINQWVRPRVLELTYTAWDLEPFARDYGWSGLPFRWDEERRFLLRCELDAAFFHLYLPSEANGEWRHAEGEMAEDLTRLKASFPTPRDAVGYIMETFPIVKRKDIDKHGDYRTKLVILDIYDRMLHAFASGQTYKTLLNPPPADPQVAHPPREGGR